MSGKIKEFLKIAQISNNPKYLCKFNNFSFTKKVIYYKILQSTSTDNFLT